MVAAAPPADEGRCIACGGQAPFDHEPGCPYLSGAADASDTMTGVAAPLLAGFTVSLATLVVQGQDDFKWPGVCVLAFTLSAVLLITAVQAGFWVRYYRPAVDTAGRFRTVPTRRQYTLWNRVARRTYNGGIFLLLLGLAGVLAPRDPGDPLRWVAAAVAALAAISELLWMWYARSLATRTVQQG